MEFRENTLLVIALAGMAVAWRLVAYRRRIKK